MKKGRLCIFSVILIVFVLILVNLVISENGIGGLDENQVPYVDPAILEAFNNTSEVSVLVNIYSRNSTKVDEVLSTLQSSEFRLEKKLQSGRGFSGNVTVEGLSLLINNSDIKTIYLNKPLHVMLDESGPIINADDVEKNDSNIINETGSISGFVKPPTEGITVFAIMRVTGYQRTGTTDENGNYKITGLTPGTYSLYVPANATTNYYTFKWSAIDVMLNENLVGYDITLTPRNSPYLLDQVIVEFYPNMSFEEKTDIINSSGSVIMGYNYAITSIENADYYTLNIPDDKTISEMIELFNSYPKIKLAHPNRISKVGTEINEEDYIEEKPENITEQAELIGNVSALSNVSIQNNSGIEVLDGRIANLKLERSVKIMLVWGGILIAILFFYLNKKWQKR